MYVRHSNACESMKYKCAFYSKYLGLCYSVATGGGMRQKLRPIQRTWNDNRYKMSAELFMSMVSSVRMHALSSP